MAVTATDPRLQYRSESVPIEAGVQDERDYETCSTCSGLYFILEIMMNGARENRLAHITPNPNPFH